MKLRLKLGWALLSLTIACGGDDGDDDADDDVAPASDGGAQDARIETDARAPVDGGAGASDAASASVDASGPVDAAAELARALAREGIQTDARRQQLVFEASCRNDIRCDLRQQSELELCVSEQSMSFGFTLLGDEECVDATLDQIACYVRRGCEDIDECLESYPQSVIACSELFGTPEEMMQAP